MSAFRDRLIEVIGRLRLNAGLDAGVLHHEANEAWADTILSHLPPHRVEYHAQATWDGVWWLLGTGRSAEEAAQNAARRSEWGEHERRVVKITVFGRITEVVETPPS